MIDGLHNSYTIADYVTYSTVKIRRSTSVFTVLGVMDPMDVIRSTDTLRWLADHAPISKYAISKRLGRSVSWLGNLIHKGGTPRLDTVVSVAHESGLSIAVVDKAGHIVATIVPDNAHQDNAHQGNTDATDG